MIKRIVVVAEIESKRRRKKKQFSCQTNLSQVLSLLCFSISVYALHRLLTTTDADLYIVQYFITFMAAAASATYGCLELELEIRAALGAIGKHIHRVNEINGDRRRRKHSIKQLIYFVGRNTRLIESAEFEKQNKK